jgi:hypothetical protein
MQAEKDKEKFPPFLSLSLSILWKLFAFVCVVEPVDFSNLSHNGAFGDEKKWALNWNGKYLMLVSYF